MKTARSNALDLYEELLDKEPATEGWVSLTGLSEAQRAVVVDLVTDIEDGNVSPDQVMNRDSARMALARFQAAVDSMTAKQCAAELTKYQLWVALDSNPDDERGYDIAQATETFTLTGLRCRVAMARFIESVNCDTAGELWQND